MSKLLSLEIKGIRSFNPKRFSKIEFDTPLTLIVGRNGTGKTTIIECLKFLFTGDVPPNSRGGAFIFDPKILNEIDVRAELKLNIICNKLRLENVRAVTSTQKNKKLEQKTQECYLVEHENGRSNVISSKIADVDSLISKYMGISPSILQNVIFCHQDEVTWPLGEPTVLKKKLDDIFCSSQYNKALQQMKISKKELESDIKLKEQNLKLYLKDKQRRNEILAGIEKYEQEIKEKIRKINKYQ